MEYTGGFPWRLKSLRKDKKLTQEQLGEKVNVSKVSISGYEKGTRNPDVDTLQKLADFFDVSTDFLLGRTDFTKDEELFLKDIHLDLKSLKEKYHLTADGEEITDEQMKAMIAFIRHYRS